MPAWPGRLKLGEFGGQALAAVLFGDVNPSGRLPITAARSAGQLPLYYALPRGSGYVSAGHPGMIRNPNGYINATARPLYCFGHGLSYTQFEYRSLSLSADQVSPDGKLTATIEVENVGDRDGDEVVQLYASDLVASMVRPEMELVGFARISIPKGEKRKVSFEIEMSQLAFLDIDMNWRIEAGQFELRAGGASDRIAQSKSFEVTGTLIIDGAARAFCAKVL